ncbi:ABC transporter substrate-binding protein [Parasphingorhabdus cellanae]|uniref:ABC transporter substrate-binding protein n=1 Tax=Parasphingorhabdus cellanae TaxID=2806553 RepID=A0ABX7T6Y6_9SPHN|nr:ABC transporter substrate-binding protein [Parasphingorhabdus cellanae]QTD56891.1 ABC transporter substrate-binding protein [Parasphingorhabdus cellanae]
MRIVSLLPSATDIVVALGAGGDLVGVSHSCSGEWDHLPKLTSTWIDTKASAAQIDRQVSTATRPLYQLDIAMLERLAPDVVISQSLCDVCAVPSGDVREAVLSLLNAPILVDLAPSRLADVPVCFGQVGEAIGRKRAATELRAKWDATLAEYDGRHAGTGLRVAFLDWLDPPFIAGHWIPDMLKTLGMTCLLGKSGEPSFKVGWDEVARTAPDIVIAACCGLDEAAAKAAAVPLDCPVLFLDGHMHFSRPSPALLPSIVMLSDAVSEFMELA